MDAIKKDQILSSQKARSDALKTNEAAAIWWANWEMEHREQIAAYNEDAAENGVWSDGLRNF